MRRLRSVRLQCECMSYHLATVQRYLAMLRARRRTARCAALSSTAACMYAVSARALRCCRHVRSCATRSSASPRASAGSAVAAGTLIGRQACAGVSGRRPATNTARMCACAASCTFPASPGGGMAGGPGRGAAAPPLAFAVLRVLVCTAETAARSQAERVARTAAMLAGFPGTSSTCAMIFGMACTTSIAGVWPAACPNSATCCKYCWTRSSHATTWHSCVARAPSGPALATRKIGSCSAPIKPVRLTGSKLVNA